MKIIDDTYKSDIYFAGYFTDSELKGTLDNIYHLKYVEAPKTDKVKSISIHILLPNVYIDRFEKLDKKFYVFDTCVYK